jgi:hypothetical protein
MDDKDKYIETLEAALKLCLDEVGEDGDPYESIPEIVFSVIDVELDDEGRLDEEEHDAARAILDAWATSQEEEEER